MNLFSKRRSSVFLIAALTLPALAVTPAHAAPLKQTKTKRANTKSSFPSTPVTDLKTGKSASLLRFSSSKKPVLVWFWAPH